MKEWIKWHEVEIELKDGLSEECFSDDDKKSISDMIKHGPHLSAGWGCFVGEGQPIPTGSRFKLFFHKKSDGVGVWVEYVDSKSAEISLQTK